MLHEARPNRPRRYERFSLKDATTSRTPGDDSVGMKRKAGGPQQLPAGPKKRRRKAETQQNQREISPDKPPELPATISHPNSTVWLSKKLQEGRLCLTKRALKEHDRLNSYFKSRFLSNSDPLYIGGSLKRFARGGGPDLQDLRGVPEALTSEPPRARSGHGETSIMPPKRRASRIRAAETPSKQSRPASPQSVSKASTAYTANFGNLLEAANVHPPTWDHTPSNLQVWMDAIEENGPSPLGSDAAISTAYRKFQREYQAASLEDEVMMQVFPAIRGESRYTYATNRICPNLADLTDDKLTIPKPDYMEGCKQTSANRRLRDVLSPFIVFADVEEAPFSPNFFTEVKGASGAAEVAERQARYDGALGARGIHRLLNIGNDTEAFDDKAYTVTFTYYRGFLQMFLHFITPAVDPEHPRCYRMTMTSSWGLHTLRGFRDGVAAYRNAQDLAHDLREEVLREALATVAQMPDDKYQELVNVAKQSKSKGKQGPASSNTREQATIIGADVNDDSEELPSPAASSASLNNRRQRTPLAPLAKPSSSKVPEKQGVNTRGTKVVSRIKSHLPKLNDSRRRSTHKG